MTPLYKKSALIAIGLMIAALLAAQIFSLLASANNATLTLKVVPSDAKLTIDGKTKKAGLISLAPGTHQLALTREGFDTQTISLTVKSKQKITKAIFLSPTTTQSGLDWMNINPKEASEAEEIAEQDAVNSNRIIADKYPIIFQLPYSGSDYKIDFGLSKKYPNDREKIAFYITAPTDQSKLHALNWIRAQGYDPNTYELIYNESPR